VLASFVCDLWFWFQSTWLNYQKIFEYIKKWTLCKVSVISISHAHAVLLQHLKKSCWELSNVNEFVKILALFRRFHLICFLSVGYSAIAINTTIEEDVLINTKKKGNKKNEVKEEKKDVPPPLKLKFTEEELNLFKVL
jgi:predicted membrane protein